MCTPNGEEGAVAAQLRSPNFCSPDEPSFRLFDLPRELRDHIYEHVLVDNSTFSLVPPKRDLLNDESTDRQHNPTPGHSLDEVTERPDVQLPGLLASVKFRPSTNVLLSSKTLRQEYEERSKQVMTLVLRDNEHYSFQPITLPEQAKEVYWAELHLILFCHNCPIMSHCDERTCQAAHEITQHQYWIKNLLCSQLTKLRSFSVHAYLCYDNYRAKNKDKVPCESIIQKKIQDLCGLPKLKSLTLCKYEFSVKPELDGPKVIMLEWPPRPPKQEGESAKTTSQECTAEQAAVERPA